MIKRLTNGDSAAVWTYLEQHTVETVLLASNISRCGLENDRMSRRAGDYYGFFSGNRLQGLLAFYNLGSVVPHFETPAAILGFAELIGQRRFEVMAGMKRVVTPLDQALRKHKKAQYYENSYYLVNHNQKLYKERLLPVVAATDISRSQALKFVVEAYRQGFKRRFNLELAARLLDDRGPEEDFVFLLDDGVPKAQAMIQSVTRSVTQIAGVYTSEHSRGRGYCKMIVSELCRRSQLYGKTPTLMVRQDNVTAVRAYQAIGFTHYSDYLLVKYEI
ncbi:GNAT family N-acetyltransferase [Sporomusa aerivorans]|uniref:GNAT family N-acetyltransferase n=1 Tax=Sporomusa aerivorans TaxID=204936 RepID=UPI00352B86A0